MKLLVFLSLFVTIQAANVDYSKNGYNTGMPPVDSVYKASMKILKEAYQDAVDKNVIVSPLGVLTLLSMYSAGTAGQSRDEIMQLCGSTDYKQLEDSYSSLTKRFDSMDTSYLVLANKVYVSEKYTLDDQFSNITLQAYNSEVEQVDFAQRESTVDTINKWATDKSNGHISSPVNEEVIDRDTAIALFNIIFFQGHWNIPFEADETKEKDFYVNESTKIKKPMMKLLTSLHYIKDTEIGAEMVELPYKEEGFRMVVILPLKKDGLSEVVEKLVDYSSLGELFSFRVLPRKVAIEMPKFEIESDLNLKDILRKVGVSSIFSEGAKGVVREQSVLVSEAFQRAFVKVDEEGATAGAFTGFVIYDRSASIPLPPQQFKVDHPFLFAILHENVLLFTGSYTH